jgi:hypothetical protein
MSAPEQPEPVETSDLYGAYPRLNDAQIAALAGAGVRRTPGRYCSGPATSLPISWSFWTDGRVAVVQDLGPAELPIAVHGPSPPGSAAPSWPIAPSCRPSCSGRT